MILPIQTAANMSAPVTDPSALRSESDVEQKVIYPLLTGGLFLGFPSIDVRTQDYLTPTDIDKGAGKKVGYKPDYTVWSFGHPLIVIEAKAPEVSVDVGLREARLYATEINKRYPPKINPIQYVVSCNGREIEFAPWDSEHQSVRASIEELTPATPFVNVMIERCGVQAMRIASDEIRSELDVPSVFRPVRFMGGPAKLTVQLGVNDFAQELLPIISKYFGDESSDVTDEIIRRAYVSSNETTNYGTTLETYLKDRIHPSVNKALKPIRTGKHSEDGLSREVSQFAQSSTKLGKVQLVVGSVGSGKSTFARRFRDHLLPQQLRDVTLWATIDFNRMPPDLEQLQTWICERFIENLATLNSLEVHSLEELRKIFSVEINRFENGSARLIKEVDEKAYNIKLADEMERWIADKEHYCEAISRHYAGEQTKGIVVLFDNVDKRGRDQQLAVFEAAQWFSELTRSLLIINLRNTTFEAHRDEPPLDTFLNAVNFYIHPPRFAQVIKKRLELVLENLDQDTSGAKYATETGLKVAISSKQLRNFLLSVYASLFEGRSMMTAAALESLVSRNVRRALQIFSDLLVSPHIPASQLTGAGLSKNARPIREDRLIRSLMCGRYKYFSKKSGYVTNIFSPPEKLQQPSNFILADILDFLLRRRKERIDFSVEGYALVDTVIKHMSILGYPEEDSREAILHLVQEGLIEPESLVTNKIVGDDAIRVHASGHIHMNYFLRRSEYAVLTSLDTPVFVKGVAERLGQIWANQSQRDELTLRAKEKILTVLSNYYRAEFEKRCRRHAYYGSNGLGGKAVVKALGDNVDGIRKLLKEFD